MLMDIQVWLESGAGCEAASGLYLMTLPDERTRAVLYAKEFLRDLLDAKKTPRVPRTVRERARNVLKHYPADYEIQALYKKTPRLFGKVQED